MPTCRADRPTRPRGRARVAAQRDPATEVQLRADTRVPYGPVAELIGLVQEAGLSRIGFVTGSSHAAAIS